MLSISFLLLFLGLVGRMARFVIGLLGENRDERLTEGGEQCPLPHDP